MVGAKYSFWVAYESPSAQDTCPGASLCERGSRDPRPRSCNLDHSKGDGAIQHLPRNRRLFLEARGAFKLLPAV